MLKNPHHQNPVVALQNIFSSVAVVYIKVNHGNPRESVALQRVTRRNGDAVEDTKPHCPVMAGMVTRWAHGAKGVFYLASHDAIGSCQHCARGAEYGIPGVGVERGIRVNLRVPRAARFNIVGQLLAQSVDARHHHAVMCQLNLGD